jgi:hypothetical protein
MNTNIREIAKSFKIAPPESNTEWQVLIERRLRSINTQFGTFTLRCLGELQFPYRQSTKSTGNEKIPLRKITSVHANGFVDILTEHGIFAFINTNWKIPTRPEGKKVWGGEETFLLWGIREYRFQWIYGTMRCKIECTEMSADVTHAYLQVDGSTLPDILKKVKPSDIYWTLSNLIRTWHADAKKHFDISTALSEAFEFEDTLMKSSLGL